MHYLAPGCTKTYDRQYHSVNERHHCSVAGSTASLSVIVRPVPVKPLIDSKTLLSGFLKAARSYVVQRNREMTGDSAPE